MTQMLGDGRVRLTGRVGGGGWGADGKHWLKEKKNQCRGYSCDASLFTSRRRGASAEREGLIGEGFWELRAGQLGGGGMGGGTGWIEKSGRKTSPTPHPPS